jgi:hypothetical protein
VIVSINQIKRERNQDAMQNIKNESFLYLKYEKMSDLNEREKRIHGWNLLILSFWMFLLWIFDG